MEQIGEFFNTFGMAVTSVVLPLLSFWIVKDSKKRKEQAEARKAQEEARKTEADNITSYATEWKELYEKKETKVVELEAKIEKLYDEKNEDRKRIRELMEKNQILELKNQSLEIMKCKRRGCKDREPPSDF